MSEDKIQEALKKFGFQPVTVNATEGQLRITMRVQPNSAGQWKVCMSKLLSDSMETPWKCDISRMYFVRDKKLFYIWRILFSNYKDYVPNIVHSLQSAPRAKVEVAEIRLAGARVGYQGGKGAQSIAGDEGIPAIAQIAVNRLRGG